MAKELPVSVYQKTTLDLIEPGHAIDTFDGARTRFAELGIIVHPVRKGRTSVPSVRLAEARGGWTRDGDYEIEGGGCKLTAAQIQALAPFWDGPPPTIRARVDAAPDAASADTPTTPAAPTTLASIIPPTEVASAVDLLAAGIDLPDPDPDLLAAIFAGVPDPDMDSPEMWAAKRAARKAGAEANEAEARELMRTPIVTWDDRTWRRLQELRYVIGRTHGGGYQPARSLELTREGQRIYDELHPEEAR